jgi:hypothetical protein
MCSDEERQLKILYMAAQLAYAQGHTHPVQTIVNGHVVRMIFTVRAFYDRAPWLTTTVDDKPVGDIKLVELAAMVQA